MTHDLVIEERLSVFGECGGLPHRIIRPQAHKPAKQQVAMQLLQWNKGQAFWSVKLTEGGIEPLVGLIRQLPRPPQRVASRNQLLDRHVGEEGGRCTLGGLASELGSWPTFAEVSGFFSKLTIRS